MKSTDSLPSNSATNLAPIGLQHWMALTAALLGWLFDGAEMGVFSMVGRRAIMDLLETKDEGTVGLWFGVITAGFLVGAATGGVLFGWLGDRIGRVHAMALSILTYALFTGLCGFAGQAWQVGGLRFIAALGMGGEWSLGVALVMEIWPNRSRAFMAGLIGSAANVGYLLVGAIGLVLNEMLSWLAVSLPNIGLSQELVDRLVSNGGWRLLMIGGAAPALLTFLIRLFVPESARWEQEKKAGATNHWATRDLWAVLVGALGPALIIVVWTDAAAVGRFIGLPSGMVEAIATHPMPLRAIGTMLGLLIATIGYTYPVVRYVARLGVADSKASGATANDQQAVLLRSTVRRMMLAAGLSGIALLGTWGSTQWAPAWADNLSTGGHFANAKEYTQMCTAAGAVLGCIVAALAGDWLGRRWTYLLMCVASLASALWMFQGHSEFSRSFLIAAFLIGGCTASFYGWLPLYLPELFRTSVRATGQGFGFNFGRILAAIGALQTGNLMAAFSGEVTIAGRQFAGGYPLACTSMSMIYLLGMLVIWFAPETKGKPLPD
jgi:MFS family permease